MYNYAEQYWDNYNDDYRAQGNDCTNFISQIMKVGGREDDLGIWNSDENWWYNWINQTHSWAGAHNWAVFARINSQRVSHIPNVYEMLVTDVLQVEWDHPDEGDEPNNIDHTMILTGRLGPAGAAEEIYLTYHASDRWNVAFWGWLLPQGKDRDAWYAHRT
ncbi:amidase domain-containing protein [Actinokineospora auranticolor]|uniref:Putative amidase-like protein n=1 Tax=Actinokineospora auranticolor TaxID=155976 RepID=A0A2S6GKB2_9PSEU|nr:amidase domain-containing protein [Actinokineospora auranticolor]PPK65674.1 putative amidase-like protein [Actinokineospora auranticolor]